MRSQRVDDTAFEVVCQMCNGSPRGTLFFNDRCDLAEPREVATECAPVPVLLQRKPDKNIENIDSPQGSQAALWSLTFEAAIG